MVSLRKMEDAAKGRLMTIKETAAMGKLADLIVEVERLEDNSRGWFEAEELFSTRCNLGRDKFEAKLKRKTATKKCERPHERSERVQ